jgi:hypothetical protein
MAKATESTKSFLGSGRRHTLVNRVGAARRRRRRRALTGACDAARAAAAARRADGRQGRVPVMIRTSIAVLAAWLPRAGGASGSAAQVLRATNETCTVHANTGVTNGHDVSRPQHLATASACASAYCDILLRWPSEISISMHRRSMWRRGDPYYIRVNTLLKGIRPYAIWHRIAPFRVQV